MIKPMTDEEAKRAIEKAKANRFDEYGNYGENNGRLPETKEEPTMEIDDCGNKSWWLNGQLHREDGPAIEWDGGGSWWYLNGKRHREGGPAVEYADGSKYWYLNGEKVTEEEVMGNKERENMNNQRTLPLVQPVSEMVRDYGFLSKQPPSPSLYEDLIEEEYEEFRKSRVAADKLKELSDLVYVSYGYARDKGWDLDEAVRRVHENNIGRMYQEDGNILRRDDGKIIKNKNYPKVDLEDLVK